MPELPEVETQMRGLKEIVGRKILALKSDTRKAFTPNFRQFRQKILGTKITKIWRRAKFLIFDLSNGLRIVTHLRMTGHFLLAPNLTPLEKTVRHFFQLQKKTGSKIEVLQFSDIRKFATLKLVTAKAFPPPELQKLGPEPLERGFTFKVFRERLAQKKGQLKAVLLDQTFVAGVGNIYADEICFASKVRPDRLINKISPQELQRIFTELKAQLKKGIKNHGTTIGEFVDVKGKFGRNQNSLKVYKRYGKQCFICYTLLQKMKISQRSTTFCPCCQQSG